MKRSANPKPAFYIKRGEMERDLALFTKRRERRERKKKTSRKAEASEWDIEAAWVEFINDNGPYELLPGHGIQGAAAVVQRSGLRPQVSLSPPSLSSGRSLFSLNVIWAFLSLLCGFWGCVS